MFKIFKNNKIDKNNNENKTDDLFDKLQERQTIYSKLDFNFEHLNKYLLRCIASYLNSIYKQDPLLCEKYLTSDFFSSFKNEMEENKKIFAFSNDYVNIVKAELIDQKLESVNYISQIFIEVEVAAVYHRQNIFTGTIKKIEEIYTENIQFEFADNGWKISKILSQNFKLMNDDIIIRL